MRFQDYLEHFYVKFGDPSCIGFWDIVQKPDTDTDKRRLRLYPATAVGVRNKRRHKKTSLLKCDGKEIAKSSDETKMYYTVAL